MRVTFYLVVFASAVKVEGQGDKSVTFFHALVLFTLSFFTTSDYWWPWNNPDSNLAFLEMVHLSITDAGLSYSDTFLRVFSILKWT